MAEAAEKLADLEMVVFQDREKERAILAGLTEEIDQAVWLPRSLIEIAYTAEGRATVTMPQWLAENRRLV